MQFLEFIEGMGIATWIRESPSIFAYTLVLSLHAIGLAIVVGISSIVALRSVGRFSGIPLEPMLQLFPLMYVGFGINLVSGLLLLAANATGMLTMIMFYLKLACIAAAIVSLRILRGRLIGGAEQTVRGPAYAVLAFWLFAIVTGRLTAYPYFVASWLGL